MTTNLPAQTGLSPDARRWPVISALGIVQIFAWGSSYYLLAVLAAPIAADTGWPLSWIVGALSIGLLAAGAGGASVFAGIAVFILTLALQISATALQVSVLTGGYYILRERQMPSGGGPQVPED